MAECTKKSSKGNFAHDSSFVSRNLQPRAENGTIFMMQKQKGFTLLELIVVMVLIGIASGAIAPTFQRWQRQQRLDTDIQEITLALADARANSLSDQMCDGEVAEEWTTVINENEILSQCVQKGGDSITLSETSLISDAALTFQEKNLASWASVGTFRVTVFPGGMNVRIGDTYQPQWAKVSLKSASINKEQTICYSRVANYLFSSPSGLCTED